MADTSSGLEQLDISPSDGPVPVRVNDMLADAKNAVASIAPTGESLTEFVQSNCLVAWRYLAALAEGSLAPGRRFVEWGSGAGVIACLAAQAGFDARGVEVQPALVTVARGIATRHAPNTRFLCASYKPGGAYSGRFDDIHPQTRTFAADCDVVYAYPWPAEETVVIETFRHLCAPDTLLLTYYGRGDFRLHRLTPGACRATAPTIHKPSSVPPSTHKPPSRGLTASTEQA